MDFTSEGYLGTQISDFIRENHLENLSFYELSEDINRYAQKLKLDIHLPNPEISQMATIALFIKILNSYQSIIILYQYGLSSQAKSIIRISLESLFVLKAIALDKSKVQLLIDTYSKETELKLSKIMNPKYKVFDSIRDQMDTATLNALKQKNKVDKIKKLKFSEWAELSNLTAMYNTMYSELSEDVHNDIVNLEQYAMVDSSGGVKFSCVPNNTDVSRDLLWSITILLLALESLHSVLGVGKIEDLEAFDKRAMQLRDTYRTSNS